MTHIVSREIVLVYQGAPAREFSGLSSPSPCWTTVNPARRHHVAGRDVVEYFEKFAPVAAGATRVRHLARRCGQRP
ncbi:MAG: hypothetical protein WB611_07380 [Stellaceae bacterium]